MSFDYLVPQVFFVCLPDVIFSVGVLELNRLVGRARSQAWAQSAASFSCVRFIRLIAIDIVIWVVMGKSAT